MVPGALAAESPDELDAVGTADALFGALKAGDSAMVESFMDPDVLIFESGGVEEGFNEYAGDHMGGDMAFMKEVEREILSRSTVERDDLAVITTRSRLTGTYRNRPVDMFTNETMVLRRSQGIWRITHAHWSARR